MAVCMQAIAAADRERVAAATAAADRERAAAADRERVAAADRERVAAADRERVAADAAAADRERAAAADRERAAAADRERVAAADRERAAAAALADLQKVIPAGVNKKVPFFFSLVISSCYLFFDGLPLSLPFRSIEQSNGTLCVNVFYFAVLLTLLF